MRASPGDIIWIAGQLRDFASSLGTKNLLIPSTDESLHSELAVMQRDHVLLVTRKGDELTGVIGGYFTAHPYNSDVKMLAERFWWVPKQHRGSRAGYLLLREFIKCGDRIADITTMSLLDNSEVDDSILLRLGFRNLEQAYIREK